MTVTAETFVLSVTRFHPSKPRLAGVDYYADKLLFSNCMCITVMLPLNTLTDNETGTNYIWFQTYRSKRTGNENHARALFPVGKLQSLMSVLKCLRWRNVHLCVGVMYHLYLPVWSSRAMGRGCRLRQCQLSIP